MSIDILKTMKRVPGGLMLVPMLVTALINTFCPALLQIGGPTTALFSTAGTNTVIGLSLFITGTQFDMGDLAGMLKRGGTFTVVKLLVGFVAGVLLARLFGLDGVFGVSLLAIVATMVSCNPGLYLALVDQYGDKTDAVSFGLFSAICAPGYAVAIVGASSGIAFDPIIVVATLVPFLLGILLGNLDGGIKRLFAAGTPMILPFLGFCFGAGIDFRFVISAGLSGVALAMAFLVINIAILLPIDRLLLRRPGYASVAFNSVAGIAVAVPATAAALMPEFAPYVNVATAQIATAVIVTNLLTPVLTRRAVRLFGDARGEKDKVEKGA